VQKVFNRKTQKRFRQHLRNTATDAEKKLRSVLKGKQLLGYKFRRQQGIEKYVVDFYCPGKKLAIEIDGVTHTTPREKEHDRQKADCIKSHGILLLRFNNSDVYENLDYVLSAIAQTLEKDQDS